MKLVNGKLVVLTLCAVLATHGAAPAVVAALGSDGQRGAPDTVTLQLKWATQAQFAGFYAARDLGYYGAEGLTVNILEGGPDITPEEVVAGGKADFGINWLPSLLASREAGLPLQNIAQLFERSAMTEIAWRDSGITSIADLRGKRVGVWCCGNQYEMLAALRKFDIDPDDPGDVEIVDQPFDMQLLLDREVDAAAAMTYNELAQVLETINPATGGLYRFEDLVVLSMDQVGVGMLEDGIFAREDWLADTANQDVAVRFLRASFRGWIACREDPELCIRITLQQAPPLGRGHQRWMMNEVNALIWPSRNGLGLMDRSRYELTVSTSLRYEVISSPPNDRAYRTDLARAALAGIPDDTFGSGWQKPAVSVTAGGE
jgi:NitT/TauT family transport system substrate-binding protein